MAQKISVIQREDFKKFIEEFENETDRAAVVLGAAKLDLVLYQILQSYLLPSASSKDSLFDGDSPLSTFSSKIDLTFRLGLIDAAFARALHLVRKIRNSFAHDVSGCSLTNGAQSDRVKQLCLPMKQYKTFYSFNEKMFKENQGVAADFRTTLGLLIGRLEFQLTRITPTESPRTQTLIGSSWKKVGDG